MPTFSISRRNLILSAGAFGLTATFQSGEASAQSYPSDEITLVIPFAAGGGTDTSARILATGLTKSLGRTVIPENRPGAGGVTGAAYVANAAPDGYTILFGGLSSLVNGPLFHANVPYDPVADFQPIGRAMGHPIILTVHSSIPVNTVEELVAYAKENPGKLNYGSSGVGSLHHLTAEFFKAEAGIDMVHIPYAGNGPATTDLLAGVVQVMFASLPQMLPYRGMEELRYLAVTSDQPSSFFPDVPTMEEAGYSGFDIAQSTYGVLAPAGIDPEIVSVLQNALNEAVTLPEVAKAIANSGLEPIHDTPEAYGDWIAASNETWSRIATEAGIVP